MFPTHDPFEHRWVISKSLLLHRRQHLCIHSNYWNQHQMKWTCHHGFFQKKCSYFGPLRRGLCDAPPKKNMGHWKGKCIFQITIFGFHVSCSRCNMLNVSPHLYPALALVGPAHLRCQAVCVQLQQGWGPRGSGIWPCFPRLWGCYECP